MYQRYESSRAAVEKIRTKESQDASKIVDIYGGSKLKIVAFYTTPAVASAGEKVLVCYSVANATEVSIEPKIESLKPAISRCVEAHPTHTTIYTLTAKDASSASETRSTEVRIR
jgi:hypothetical protein